MNPLEHRMLDFNRHLDRLAAPPPISSVNERTLQEFYAAANRRDRWRRRGWTALVVLASYGWPVAAYLWAVNR